MGSLRLDARLPVVLITGYLGSGKTTVLNHLLGSEEFRQSAVAINEFGEAGLDGAFLQHFEDEALVIAGGCACCTLKADFEQQLLQVYSRARGSGQPLSRLVIETSGMADPIPLVQFLIGNPVASKLYRVERILCTVDAIFGERRLGDSSEAVNQLALADVIIVTKTDLNPDGMDRLVPAIRSLSPRAEIIAAVDGQVDTAGLVACAVPTEQSRASDVSRWLGVVEDLHTGSGHAQLPHAHPVMSCTLKADRQLDPAAFSDWLRRIRISHSEQLLRIKGVLHLLGRPRPVAIHGVHHIFHRMVELPNWPTGDSNSTVVFIFRTLDRAVLEEGWDLIARAEPPVRRGGEVRLAEIKL